MTDFLTISTFRKLKLSKLTLGGFPPPGFTLILLNNPILSFNNSAKAKKKNIDKQNYDDDINNKF